MKDVVEKIVIVVRKQGLRTKLDARKTKGTQGAFESLASLPSFWILWILYLRAIDLIRKFS